jgi:hypothetical protein
MENEFKETWTSWRITDCIRKICCDEVDCSRLAQGRDKLLAVVSTVMNEHKTVHPARK